MVYLMDASHKKKTPFVLRDEHNDDDTALRWYYLRKRRWYKWVLGIACTLYLTSSLTETPLFNATTLESYHREKNWYEIFFDVLGECVFSLDIFVQCKALGARRVLIDNKWTLVFLGLLAFDWIGLLWPILRVLMVTGIVRFYPIVYYSRKARNALVDYGRTLPNVLLWIALEFFMLVVYSCLCVVLFASVDRDGRSKQIAFSDFDHAFISLYSLSLTVNNPNIYIVSLCTEKVDV